MLKKCFSILIVMILSLNIIISTNLVHADMSQNALDAVFSDGKISEIQLFSVTLGQYDKSILNSSEVWLCHLPRQIQK